VLSSAVVAWAGFDTLDNFVALIGGFCSVPLAIIYPVLMHSLLATSDAAAGHTPLDTSDMTINALVGVAGIGIGLFASVFAIWTWPR
jgi:hypothetical protein